MTFKNSKKRKQTKNKKDARQSKRRQWRNYRKYERYRREEAKKKKARINYLRKLILANDCTMTENEISQFLCILDMVFHNHSYRVHVTYMYEHSDYGDVYGLERIPSKSCLHDWAKRLSFDVEWVTGLLLMQAGDKVIRDILGDASGFANMKIGRRQTRSGIETHV